MAGERILLVDDEKSIRTTLAAILNDEGYRPTAVGTGPEALAELKRQWPELPVIMISGHGTIETAVKATRLGAYDFIEKPLSLDKTLLTVTRALDHARLERENAALRQRLQQRWDIIGTSPAIHRLREQIATAAPSNGRVLIDGENG